MSISLTPEEETRYAEIQELAIDAARAGDVGILAPMLEAGLAPNLADHKGNTLIMLASYNNQPEAVALLANHGAETDRRNNRGQTPLAGVAFKGYLRCAQLLVEHGADPEAAQGHGQTPISFAAMFGRTEVLSYLQEVAQSRRPIRNKFLQIFASTVQVFRPKFA